MATSEKIQTGFIGLGKMGYHIAHNLLKASFSLTVCDCDEKPIQELVRMEESLERISNLKYESKST